MGACASVHRDSAFGSSKQDENYKKQNQNQILIPSSPTKLINKPITNGIAQWPPIPQSTASFSDIGSKDEAFFDSQAWMDSDCESEDFMSVRGDFTPSRGNTPVHHNFSAGTPKVNPKFSAGTPKVNESLLADQTTPVAIPDPSPNTQRKRLSDLFKDSLRTTHDDDNNEEEEEEDKLSDNKNEMSEKLDTHFAPEANSASSNERRTASGTIRENSMRSVQWCLPNMLSTRSYAERKKKTSPSAPIVVG